MILLLSGAGGLGSGRRLSPVLYGRVFPTVAFGGRRHTRATHWSGPWYGSRTLGPDPRRPSNGREREARRHQPDVGIGAIKGAATRDKGGARGRVPDRAGYVHDASRRVMVAMVRLPRVSPWACSCAAPCTGQTLRLRERRVDVVRGGSRWGYGLPLTAYGAAK